MSFQSIVRAEVDRAREKHKPINSVHEGYAVLLEEVDEFWEEVKKKRESRDHSKMLSELVQVAAMAQRTAEDCGLTQIDPEPWSTERPPGWGVGCWFRMADQCCICTRFERLGPTGSIIWVTGIRLTAPLVDVSIPEKNITSYGPRAECPKGGEG